MRSAVPMRSSISRTTARNTQLWPADWVMFPLESSNGDPVRKLRVILTRFSRIRERLQCGEAGEQNVKIEQEVIHSSSLSPKS
jgi:hypothetical protein